MAATIHYPPAIINAYMANVIDTQLSLSIPFFPTTNTASIDSLTETFPQADGKFAVYDRMFRMNKKPFPHIYCEQLLYYFYDFNNSGTAVIELSQKVHDHLNQLDESAEEINRWAKANTSSWSDSSLPLYFHSFKVYQLQETRDIIDFGTARTYAGNKIIIEYDWHKYEPIAPEDKGQFTLSSED